MLVVTAIGALLLSAQASSLGEGWRTSIDLTHGCGGENSTLGGVSVAVAPDAQVAVFLRNSPRAELRCQNACSDLVFFDLKQGREVAAIDRGFAAEDQFAISRDGRLVVCLLQQELGKWDSFDVAVWRPRESPLTLEPFDDLTVKNQGDPDTGSDFWPKSWAAPALSPDASHVAFFAMWLPGPGRLARDVVLVLDLESKKMQWIPVPIETSPGMGRAWQLGWDAKGEAVLMLLHGDYEDTTRKNEYGGTDVLMGAPEYALYRWVPGEEKIAKVASIAGRPLGFGADGELLLANIDEAAKKLTPAYARVWGFGRAKVPVRDGAGIAQGGVAAVEATSLPIETVVDPKACKTSGVLGVFVGSLRSYARVRVTEGSTTRILLVERGESPAR